MQNISQIKISPQTLLYFETHLLQEHDVCFLNQLFSLKT